MADVLKQLLHGSNESTLLAYQIAFDLVESEHQHFVIEVTKHLPPKKEPEGESKDAGGETKEGAEVAATDATEAASAATGGMEVDGEGGADESEEYLERMDKLRQVLVDGFGIDLALNFLYKMNKTDLLVMKNIKGSLDNRNSVLHNATVVAHGYMQAGTTVSGR